MGGDKIPGPLNPGLMRYVEATVRMMKGNPGGGLYKYLLKNGTLRTGSKPVKNHPVLGTIPELHVPKGCYRNASLAALVCDDVKYIEGIAMGRILPVSHAWIEYKGEIYDPTWEKFNDLDQCEYLGVEVPKEYVERMVDSDIPWMTPLLEMLKEGRQN